MRHPFDLALEDLKASTGKVDRLTENLEFEERVPPSEAACVGGRQVATTLALGEEGGSRRWPRIHPYPDSKPKQPIDPPVYTTLALGEEGGANPPEVTTLAIGEEGGIPIM